MCPEQWDLKVIVDEIRTLERKNAGLRVGRPALCDLGQVTSPL